MGVGGGSEIMAGRGWWRQNCGWLWVVMTGGSKIMAVRGWSHDLAMPFFIEKPLLKLEVVHSGSFMYYKVFFLKTKK